MKRSKLFVIVFLFLMAGAVHLTNAQTVYITEKGKKFHKKNCSVAGEDKKGLSVKEAKKQGLEPCKVCHPETSSIPEKQEAIEPKEKK